MGLAVLAALIIPSVATGQDDTIRHVRHDLHITLQPEAHRLIGRDTMVVSAVGSDTLTCYLAAHADVESVEINNLPVDYRLSQGRLSVSVPGIENGSDVRLSIRYSAVFDDPYPEMPVNTDNPGYGVTGIISNGGTFLLAGAGWYPTIPSDRSSFHIQVTAPKGVVAVTGGRSMGRRTEGDRTVSIWKIDQAVEGLALSAARYIVSEREMGNLSIATYFFEQTQPLSKRYLDAVEQYIRMYEDLFGPYPFEKFAVVENFFPTGYGFPSYTLMGGRVLRLPFIVTTSLGHEIAHCWWGNGVLVDYDKGNWSEGLTSYVADYLYKEKASEKSATEHRRQWLRNYATLVDASSDFPLTKFRSRVDKATRTIGYDKSAMVFHMIRQRVGEAAFWGALQDIYTEKRFKKASWSDFQRAFERRSSCGGVPCRLDWFFDQWITRRGAPRPTLDNVRRKQLSDGTWTVTGRIVQKPPYFALRIKVLLHTDSGPDAQWISLKHGDARFELSSDARPTSVALDPGADVFRQLTASEIPSAVNSIKGADSVLMVLTEQAGSKSNDIAGLLARSFGLKHAGWIPEADLNDRLMKDHDLIFIGFPKNRSLIAQIPSPVAVEESRFSVGSRQYSAVKDTLFAAFPHPVSADRSAGLLFSPGGRLDVRTAMKLTHYGRYSYLGFQNGKNMDKGTWPVTTSPLIFSWKEKALK